MKPGILRSTLYVTLFSALAIILNLASQLIIAYYFGAKFQRDAYFVAISIPLFLITVINGSLGYIFIPQVVEKKEKESNEHVNQFIYSTFIFLFFFILILIVSLSLFNNEIVSLFFSNYNISEKKAISTLLLILLPTILFNVISSFLSSLYQIEGIFLVPAIANILNITVNILIFVLLNDKYGINGLAIAYLCGSVTLFLFQLPILSKYNLRLKSNFNKQGLLIFLKISFPLLLGGIFFRFTTIFEKIIASNLSKGSISYLGYSSQIITVLGTITSNGISIVIFPLLSKHWSNNNSDLIKHYIRKSLRIILLLTIPISIYLLFFGNFIISKTFQRGAFSLETTVSVSRALKFSLGAFIFQSIGSIIVKLFYISGYTKVNTIISSIELVVYIILSYLLVNTYSYIGLPIALTISSGLSIAASIYYLNHKIILIGYINILKDIFLIFSLSLISILFIYLINMNIYIYNDILTISISTIIGVLIFFIIGINIKIEELNVIQKFLFRKFQKLQDES